MGNHTLVVIRHAKSDWSVTASDRDRPLAPRGHRQAPLTGTWLADNGYVPDLAVVSPARRARQTWDLVAAAFASDGPGTNAAPTLRVDEAAYTFDGNDLLALVRRLPEEARVVALVSHNPAVEELVEDLTGGWVPMPTSALAVIEVDAWRTAGVHPERLIHAGRPADD